MLGCETGQKIGNFPPTQFAWMPFAVEENEATDPIEITLLGADCSGAPA
jgi:hypothetical protein